jgi:predicted MPP superfamily phosphohydrolase
MDPTPLPVLRFRPDGTFTIAQFTDLHWQNGNQADLQTRALMERVLEAERPDLVVLTGDVIAGGCQDPSRSWLEAVAPMEQCGVPWAAAFGNHDDEGALSRADLMALQRTACRWCLSEAGPEDVPGVGNFVRLIASSKGGNATPAAALYFLDSGSYAPSTSEIGGYGWVTFEQIGWYRRVAQDLARSRQADDAPLTALAFFHIPLPEFNEVWDHHLCGGVKHEPVCCPRINTGLFAAFYEAGDVRGVFVGHDHVNDFEGDLHGIRLCYGRASGYNTYGKEGFPRGARLIRLREGEQTFTTWLRLDNGSVVNTVTHGPEHAPGAFILNDGGQEADSSSLAQVHCAQPGSELPARPKATQLPSTRCARAR